MRRVTCGETESVDDADTMELLKARPMSSTGSVATTRCRRTIAICFLGLLAAGLLTHGLLREWTDASELHVVTWNIAAINNNPFEYWITHEDADYNKLMVDVEEFISSPGEHDVPVEHVFTPAMWAELKALMAARGWTGLGEVESRWTSDLSQRKIISGFLKDKVRMHRNIPACAIACAYSQRLSTCTLSVHRRETPHVDA